MEKIVLWQRCIPRRQDVRADPDGVASWNRLVCARTKASGGTVLGTLGGSVATVFEPNEGADALELALQLMADVESSSNELRSLELAIGIATGEIVAVRRNVDVDTWLGNAIDRAQSLANLAGPGDILVDRRTRRHANDTFLFRLVTSERRVPRTYAIDREHPYLQEARDLLLELEMDSVALMPPSFEVTVARPEDTGPLLLRATSSDEALSRWIAASVQRALGNVCLIELGSAVGSAEPFGSLRRALLRQGSEVRPLFQSQPVGTADAVGSEGELRRQLRGVETETAALAPLLLRFLDVERQTANVVLIAAYGHETLDEASLELIGELSTMRSEFALVVLAIEPEADAQTPTFWSGATGAVDHAPLGSKEVTFVAGKCLEGITGELADHIAALGLYEPSAIVEAIAFLVSAGSLVRSGRNLGFRAGARFASRGRPATTWQNRRLRGLDAETSRTLSLVCMAPAGTSAKALEAAACHLGLSSERFRRAASALTAARFLTASPWLAPTSTLLRRTVQVSLDAAARTQLHRALALALKSELHAEGPFPSVAWVHHASQSMTDEQAVREAVTRAAEVAGSTHRKALIEQLRRLEGMLPARAPSNEREPGSDRASSTGDSDRRPSLLPPLANAQSDDDSLGRRHRRRALDLLVKNDLAGARRAMLRALDRQGADESERARLSITEALLELNSGATVSAVRHAVAALSSARRVADLHGEAAALKLLATCYRTLGREQEADCLDGAATALRVAV